MKREEAEKLVEALVEAAALVAEIPHWAGDGPTPFECEKLLDEARDALIAALTTPEPAAGDVELVDDEDGEALLRRLGIYEKHMVPVAKLALNICLSRLRAVPLGWRLVPVEPTEEMIEAYGDAQWPGDEQIYADEHEDHLAGHRAGYAAMLAAAPAAPAPKKAT
jgi:hypothetical protein